MIQLDCNPNFRQFGLFFEKLRTNLQSIFSENLHHQRSSIWWSICGKFLIFLNFIWFDDCFDLSSMTKTSKNTENKSFLQGVDPFFRTRTFEKQSTVGFVLNRISKFSLLTNSSFLQFSKGKQSEIAKCKLLDGEEDGKCAPCICGAEVLGPYCLGFRQ